jgi:hypothetical protein
MELPARLFAQFGLVAVIADNDHRILRCREMCRGHNPRP